MRRFLLSCLFASAALAAPPAEPPAEFAQPQSPTKPAPFAVKYVDQGTFDPKLKGLLAPEGFKVELVSDAPTIINPVGITFAPDGTLFALEWKPDPGREWYEFKETFRFRDGTTKAVATMKKFVQDPVKVLKRNPKTGVYDQSEVILTDELPSSILYHDGWLYLSGRGTIRRYRQSQPNGKWDLRETIAQGFCGFHHHQVSGMTIGPDGWLYITSGDDDNFAEGSDGSRATVLRTGAVFRCKLDGSKMETYSIGYRNPYRDLALDDKFNWFHCDNDNEDGSRFTGCRLLHVAEDVDYGWRLFEGARCCRPDHVRGAVAGERPGKLMPMLKTGRGSPAGVLIYNDTQLPEQYRGLMYYPDVFRKVVRAYSVAPKGSTFEISHEFEFLKSEDPLFRPCQMITGPDGAIYVCDWRADSGGAGKLWGDGVHGRIYRMSWVGTNEQPALPLRGMDSWAKLAGAKSTLEELAKGIRSDDATTQMKAQIEAAIRGKTQPIPIRNLFGTLVLDEQASIPSRLLGIGGLQQFWNIEVEPQMIALLKDKNADVRRMACDALGRNASAESGAGEALTQRLFDESFAVRRAAVLALGRLGTGGAADAILNAWKGDEGKDSFLSDAYLRALERLGTPGIQGLLTLAQSGDEISLKKVVTAFLALRSKLAFEAIPELLGHPHVGDEQKIDLIRSYSNYQFDPPVSLDALAKFIAKSNQTIAVKTAALDQLSSAGSLSGGAGADLVRNLLDSKDEAARIAAWTAIEKSKLPIGGAKLSGVLSDSKLSLNERTAAIKAAKSLGGVDVQAALKDLLASTTESAGLKVEALRTLAALDPNSSRTFAEKLLDQPDPGLLGESVAVLVTTKAGAKLVAERYLAKKLPRDFFPRVSDGLRKYPGDSAIAALNTEVLRGGLLLSMEPDQIEAIRKTVLAKGDPKRGKAVYLNTAVVACASCHKLEGLGGQVGPDLTRIWDTMTVEKLLESMVTPSKEIKEGYQSYKAVTLDGQSYVGLKVADTATDVTIREATGRDVKINKKDVDELSVSKISLMPDNVVSQLSYEQFIDLIAFLKSRKEQESLRGAVLNANAILGLPADLETKTPMETKLENLKPLAADLNGYLPVQSLMPNTNATGALIVAYVYSPKPQTITGTLLADDPIRISVGGKVAFERKVAKLQPFIQEEKFSVEVPAGWSAVTMRVVTTGQTHRIGLQFAGDELRTAIKAEK